MEKAKIGKVQLWRKALLHSSLCFVMGFFTGFAPATVSDWAAAAATAAATGAAPALSVLPRQIPATRAAEPQLWAASPSSIRPRNPLIVITTTDAAESRAWRSAALTRLAHTLRLVPPPVLWVVVEARSEAAETARLLRATGVMYRHVTFRKPESPSASADEVDEGHRQRNVALEHVERRRLAGVVHFAGLADYYDLRLFEAIRAVDVFGVWPVARLRTAGEKGIAIEGPTCQSGGITGWLSSNATAALPLNGLAFNSSVLWEADRWDSPISEPDRSQDSMRYVQEALQKQQSKLKGIPSDCSKIMAWRLDLLTTQPNSLSPPPQNR